MSIGKAGRFVGLLALLLGFGLGGGCNSENATGVDCDLQDCQAACELKGYPNGECEDDLCRCEGGDGSPYPWDVGGKDTDSESPFDAGSSNF